MSAFPQPTSARLNYRGFRIQTRLARTSCGSTHIQTMFSKTLVRQLFTECLLLSQFLSRRGLDLFGCDEVVQKYNNAGK